jgi:hypothetical protein
MAGLATRMFSLPANDEPLYLMPMGKTWMK